MNLFLSHTGVVIQPLAGVGIRRFVVHQVQCPSKTNGCLHHDVTGGWWHAADTANTHLLAHDVCSLHDALGQEPMAAGQDGCLLQGHTQRAPERGNQTQEITDWRFKTINRHVQDTYLIGIASVSYLLLFTFLDFLTYKTIK